ncbi:hypothetical protein KUTeg_008402 [Tegillarca granosa]|uniref:PiggyBac transposable element-derived protein domain-containing protein n=1 Tax=Tegillarca granosa TaxID=220873 RepID=A0ABQ9FC93_TEGGR|nr:hypothetical protein KUTeg_008402 [Tegillarca granosa]
MNTAGFVRCFIDQVWMRCDPDGYCHDFRPYLGKHDIFRGRGLGERVVTHMCRDLKWKSHHVHVISTTSNPVGDGPVIRKIRGGGEAEIMRPPPLEDYHKYMSGVDRNMQHRSKNPVGRPAKKYWKFLVNFILEECIINAFLIWKQTEGVNKPRAVGLINDFSSRKIAKSVPKSVTPVVPLDRHQCVKLNRKRSTCKLCTKHGQKKREETLFGCSACSVHLCRGLCFQLYHDQFK